MIPERVMRTVFNISIFMLAVSGFAQMPIFKRYYIADIPGLGWLAAFFTTHLIHYIAAAVFLFCVSYYLAGSLAAGKRFGKWGKGTLFRAFIYSGLIITGFILVLYNFPGHLFSEMTIILTDFMHLGLVMVFLVFSGANLVYNNLIRFSRKL